MLCPTVKGTWVGKGIDSLYLLGRPDSKLLLSPKSLQRGWHQQLLHIPQLRKLHLSKIAVVPAVEEEVEGKAGSICPASAGADVAGALAASQPQTQIQGH